LQFAGLGPSPPPTPAGFICLGFSWALVPPLFSSVESCQPSTAVVLVYLEFVQGTSFPPLSGGACHVSATVADLAHSKLTGRGCQTHLLWQACLFTVRVDACPSFSRAQGAPPSLLHVFFNSLFIVQLFFFCGVGIRLSRGLRWFILGVAVGIPCAAYLLTCWSASSKQVRSQCLAVQKPSWFLHIKWCGEAPCRLGVQGCRIFASSWWFFLPGLSPVSQQDFSFMKLTLFTSSL
jgi:hypothetical protein